MLAGDPENTMVLFGLANEYLKNGDAENGIKTLERYLSLADDEGAAWGMLADAYQSQGEVEKANDALKSGIAAASKHGHPTMVEQFSSRLDES